MIKFAYLCNKSEEKKKKCKCIGLNCNNCSHTFDPDYAKHKDVVDYGLRINEIFHSPAGTDVTRIESEESNEKDTSIFN